MSFVVYKIRKKDSDNENLETAVWSKSMGESGRYTSSAGCRIWAAYKQLVFLPFLFA